MTVTLSRTQQNDIIKFANVAVRAKVASRYKEIFSDMDIEDTIGSTISKAWLGINSFDPSKGKLSTWVGTAAEFCVLNTLGAICNGKIQYGATKKDDDADDYDFDDEIDYYAVSKNPSSDDAHLDSDLSFVYDDLTAIADTFKGKDRVYAHMIIAEMDSKEMAEATGDSLSCAQVRACRVRKAMRERYYARTAA